MIRTFGLAALALLAASCAEEVNTSYVEKERLALREWMELNRPELLENYQEEGGYWVDVLEPGSDEAAPIRDTACWVRFTFTGRNLGGDIVLTRNETDARLVGSYTPFTRYVPYYKYYAGDTNTALLEGTYLSMHNRLKLGAAYAEARGLEREVELRCGSKVTLYMPSTVVGDGGVTGSGGYEGQSGYALKSGRPFVATLEITDTVYNPLRREGVDVDDFARNNGGLKPVKPRAAAAVRAGEGDYPIYDPNNPYYDGFAWRNAADSIPQVYINVIYKPTERFRYPEIYASQYEPYSDFERLEQAICDTLVNRFGPYDGPQKLKSDSVTLNGTAKIWYIARFLDGFVLDSNIPGVRGLVFGEKEAKGSVESYTPSRGGMIEAFYYSIPVLRYGQWAAILTTSTNAYGAAGKAGTTSTTSTGGSNYSDLLNYYNYMQAYYGANGYYNGMYNDYYNNYMFGLYNNYNVPNQSDKVTTTTVQTEVPSFTPLLFQIYIEPKAEK